MFVHFENVDSGGRESAKISFRGTERRRVVVELRSVHFPTNGTHSRGVEEGRVAFLLQLNQWRRKTVVEFAQNCKRGCPQVQVYSELDILSWLLQNLNDFKHTEIIHLMCLSLRELSMNSSAKLLVITLTSFCLLRACELPLETYYHLCLSTSKDAPALGFALWSSPMERIRNNYLKR